MLVELLQICLWLDHESLLSDVAKRLGYNFIESLRLLDQLLLHREQVPVFADRLEQIVKKLFKFFSQVVPNEQNVVPQIDLMLAKRCTNRLVQNRLTILYLLKRCLYLLLETLLEVQLIERAERHDRMQQMS